MHGGKAAGHAGMRLADVHLQAVRIRVPLDQIYYFQLLKKEIEENSRNTEYWRESDV